MNLEASFTTDVVTLAARLWTGIMLLVFYALEGISGAWLHIWQEQPWPLMDAATARGIPSPVILLTTAFGLLCLACLGLLVGLFTRISAFLVLIVLACVLYFLSSDLPSVELALIYMLGPIVILAAGSGNWALDTAMKRNRPTARR